MKHPITIYFKVHGPGILSKLMALEVPSSLAPLFQTGHFFEDREIKIVNVTRTGKMSVELKETFYSTKEDYFHTLAVLDAHGWEGR